MKNIFSKIVLAFFCALLLMAFNSCSNDSSESKDAEISLTAISIAQTPSKTNYTVGDTFSAAGLKITATYSDSSTKTISYPATGLTVAQADLTTSGTKAISVSYTENSVTKDTTFSITVSQKTNDGEQQEIQNPDENPDGNDDSDKKKEEEEKGDSVITEETVGYNEYTVKTYTKVLKESESDTSADKEIILLPIKEDGTYTLEDSKLFGEKAVGKITRVEKHYYWYSDCTSEREDLASITYTAEINALFSEIKMTGNGESRDLDALYSAYTSIQKQVDESAKKVALSAVKSITSDSETSTEQIKLSYADFDQADSLPEKSVTMDLSNTRVNVDMNTISTYKDKFNISNYSEPFYGKEENQGTTTVKNIIPGIDLVAYLQDAYDDENGVHVALSLASDVNANVNIGSNYYTTYMYNGGIIADKDTDVKLGDISSSKITGSFRNYKTSNNKILSLLSEMNGNELPTFDNMRFINKEKAGNLFGTGIDKILASGYDGINNSKVENLNVDDSFNAVEYLNGESMFKVDENGKTLLNSIPYSLDINAAIHIMDNDGYVGNVRIIGEKHTEPTVSNLSGGFINVSFALDYSSVDFFYYPTFGVILSESNAKLPQFNVSRGTGYSRFVLSENETTDFYNYSFIDVTNLSKEESINVKNNSTSVNIAFNPEFKNEISAPSEDSQIYYFGNQYKTTADNPTQINGYKAGSVENYETAGNMMFSIPVVNESLIENASYFDSAEHISKLNVNDENLTPLQKLLFGKDKVYG